jgi:hypothetical protein
VVPGIYLYAAWSVALPVLMIEGLGARESLGRSRALLKGRWWPVAGVMLAATLATYVVYYGFIALVLGVIGRGPTVLSAAAVTNAAIAIGMIIVNPFYSTVRTILYYDLDLRHKDRDGAVRPGQLAPQEPPRRDPMPSLGPPPGASALERLFRRNQP